jgi:hypothetical protein
MFSSSSVMDLDLPYHSFKSLDSGTLISYTLRIYRVLKGGWRIESEGMGGAQSGRREEGDRDEGAAW